MLTLQCENYCEILQLIETLKHKFCDMKSMHDITYQIRRWPRQRYMKQTDLFAILGISNEP